MELEKRNNIAEYLENVQSIGKKIIAQTQQL